MGFGALRVWQSLSEAQGRGRGDEELAILFTDLVGFSSWALEAGDTLAVDLVREVGRVTEPCVEEHGGRIVKRLGDGLMVVFGEPAEAIAAAHAMERGLGQVSVEGHSPALRAGVHVGRPRGRGGGPGRGAGLRGHPRAPGRGRPAPETPLALQGEGNAPGPARLHGRARPKLTRGYLI